MAALAKSIEFRDVSFRLPDGKALLEELNLEVSEGETLVLLGRSGSGKTTTMKLINRLIDPTSGEVRVGGKATLEWDPIKLRRRIGYVIQEVGLFPHFSVEENIAVVPRLEGWEPDRVKSRAHELLNLVGLDPEKFVSRLPKELSGGQRQRVGVARALAADPPFILLDEPFGALDPITRREIQVEFRSLQERLRKTMVFVTHDVREAFFLASQICLLRDGRAVLIGKPEDFLKSADAEVQAFIGCLDGSQVTEKRS
ncbi:MAG: ABC transporter ATP-binding protein [Candidatus Binatia bacterium]